MLTEIQNLLATGSPTETSLITLDRSLESKIKALRAKAGKGGEPEATASLKLNSTGGANKSDVQSVAARSSRSARASNAFVKGADANKSRYLVYEDPAASLNVSEEKWNAIV